MASLTILVVGATGQQGGAVIQSLLSSPRASSQSLHILALTRDPSTPRAQSLASAHPGALTLVQGDSSTPAPIFATRAPGLIDALFLVTTNMGSISEEQQAIPLIDAAAAHGVRHIVFSSVDRGGDAVSWTNPTRIKHFYEKHNVELYLRKKAQESTKGFTWAIVRPVAFLDNFNRAFGAIFAAMWAAHLPPANKLQMVSVHDIGRVATQALLDPGTWSGRAVGLAGEEMTLAEAKAKFKRVVGKDLPQSWWVVGKGMLLGMKEMRLMFDFFRDPGYHVDIGRLREEVGGMQDMEMWLRESSEWKA